MNDDDLQKVISTLTRNLRESGLEWVLEEYFETVQAGKVETKSAKYEHWNEEEGEFKVSGRPKTVTGTVALTLEEQAILLIEAIENAIIIPHDVVLTLDRDLSQRFGSDGIREISFEPDLESVAKTPDLEDSLPSKMQGFNVNFREVASRNDAVKNLQEMCDHLKEAIAK